MIFAIIPEADNWYKNNIGISRLIGFTGLINHHIYLLYINLKHFPSFVNFKFNPDGKGHTHGGIGISLLIENQIPLCFFISENLY